MSLMSTPFPLYDLPMYDLPELAQAHEQLWRRFVALVRHGGFSGDFALTQTCGYPLATALRDRFDVIAAPVYDVPFSKSATHCGLIVVAAASEYTSLDDLRGARFALNSWDSNTGMNLPRRLVAPLAREGRFFGEVIETGSHVASLAAIDLGVADVASIDSVTFALLAEHRPAAVAGVRILTTTAPSPTLPFVAPASANRRLRTLLYESLAATIDELRRAGSRSTLHLVGIERASIGTYDPLLVFEREAIDRGYGTLA
jgi:ABC-type phosphate/phosphonate transport system substrate-binding protein